MKKLETKTEEKTEKRSVGRPPHEPTDETRYKVKAMIFAGFSQEKTAELLGISQDTLARHYRAELDDAQFGMLSQVGQSLWQKALNGDTAAQIFIAKTRLGWREKPQQVELSGADGGPIEVQQKGEITSRLLSAISAAKAKKDSE